MSGRAALFRNLNNGSAIRFLLFLPAYLVAYKYGSLFSQTSASPLWSPDSVLLCWLLASPSTEWWIYLVAPLPIRLTITPPSTIPLWFLLITFANDSLKGLFSGYVLRRVLGRPIRLDTMRAFAIFIATAATAAPILSALGGAAARHGLGYSFWPSWYQWFLGNSLASLLITPTLLYWSVGGQSAKRRPKELALLASGLAVVSYYAFVIPHTLYFPLLLYVPLPFLIWAVVRTGPVGTSTALSVLSIVSTLSSALGKGVFSVGSRAQNVLSLQLFLLLVSVPLLFLAVLVEERQAIQEELRRSQKKVGEHFEEIRNLAGRLVGAQEGERRRIARELHDDISQRFALLSIEIQRTKEVPPTSVGDLRSRMDELEKQASEISTSVESLSHELHSSRLEYLGIVSAIRGFCKEFGDKHKVTVDFDDEGIPPTVPQDISLCLFRVMQEGLHNAAKHSGVRVFEVKLHGSPAEIQLIVRDSGVGFDPELARDTQGLGLISMQERVRLVKGTISITSRPQSGTEINVRVPLSAGESGEQAEAAGA